MTKIAITTTSFGKYDKSPLERLREVDIEYVFNRFGRKLTGEEVSGLAKGMDGIVAGIEPLNAQVLNTLPGLKVISRCGTGMDNVDLETARELGIKVYNTPCGPTLAVAELTVGLILDLLRKTSQMDRELRVGIWKKRMGNLLCGKRVGIVGFGRIGQRVAELLLPFDTEIHYCDVSDVSCNLPCSPQEFEALLSWADIICLHMSQPKMDGPILGEKEIALMKKGAWLVNTARGGVVDEEALYWALENGHLAGAALDVYEKEPYNGLISTLENVVLTPHIGSYALEARVAMEMDSVENLLKGLTEESP